MIIPVRCFTCGTVVASAWEPFLKRTGAGEDPAKVLADLGRVRYCCRRMVLSNADLMDDVIPFG